MAQPSTRRLVTEAALEPVLTRLGLLDSKGQRGYTVSQSAGRVITVWDYLNNREQLVYGDTGVRDIAASLPTMTEGTARIRRNGSAVSLAIDTAKFSNTGTFTLASVIPPGFRPDMNFNGFAVQLSGADGYRASITTAGNLAIYSYSGGWVRGYLTWTTADTWPTALPGTAVGGVA